MTSPITYADLVGWDAELEALTSQVAGPLFTRPEPRSAFTDLIRGLLADVGRKNSWQIGDHVGHASGGRLEWLLNGASWDAGELRDRVRDHVVGKLGSADAVLVVDDTQVIKQGKKSVGVAPQHCGLTGQTENCQVWPMLTYASDHGHAFIDRRLYLPGRWMDDRERCAQAGVPASVEFATKPHQAADMLIAAIDAQVPFGFFAADSGYGRDPYLRQECHDRAVPYVMAVPVDLPLAGAHGRATRPDKILAACVDPATFERRSCGQGTKGERLYDWAQVAVQVKGQSPADGLAHTLLIRRSISDPADIEFFLAHARHGTPAAKLIQVAGMRWKIEENNGQGKDLLGMDQYQVRKWAPTLRHVTASMLAQAFLAGIRADLGKDTQPRENPAC